MLSTEVTVSSVEKASVYIMIIFLQSSIFTLDKSINLFLLPAPQRICEAAVPTTYISPRVFLSNVKFLQAPQSIASPKFTEKLPKEPPNNNKL